MPDATGIGDDDRRGQRIGTGFRLGILLGLVLCAGCTAGGMGPAASNSAAGGSTQALAASESAPINGTGLLWRVDIPDRAPSYLFGTMHVSDPRIVILPPAVEDAFEASDAVGLEVVEPDGPNDKIEAMLRLPEGGDLERIIGPDLFEAIYRLGESEEEFKEEVRRLRPWAAAIMLEQLRRSPGGAPVLDDRLEEAARTAGKTVFGLETAEENLAVYRTLPDMHQIDLLRSTLQSLYTPAEIRLAVREADIRAYMARETGLLVQRWNAAYGGGDRTLQQFGDRLLRERSGLFVERMVPWIEKGGAFLAVGAAHLPGKDGVVAALQGRGFDVVAVY